MNAVEFFFALSAVTFMTTVIYFWTRFVYKLEAQDNVKPPQRKTAYTPDKRVRARRLALCIQLRARRDVSYELAPGRVAAIRANRWQA